MPIDRDYQAQIRDRYAGTFEVLRTGGRSYRATAREIARLLDDDARKVQRELRHLAAARLVEVHGVWIEDARTHLWTISDQREQDLIVSISDRAKPDATVDRWRSEVLDEARVWLDYLKERDAPSSPMWARWLSRMISIAQARAPGEGVEVGWYRAPMRNHHGKPIGWARALTLAVRPDLIPQRTELSTAQTIAPPAWLRFELTYGVGAPTDRVRAWILLTPREYSGMALVGAFRAHAAEVSK
jgi:hypothetical protein